MNTIFAQEILQGLHQKPKRLPSKYFYDETGDRLFQQIMALPEYYLTRCETEIMHTHKESLRQVLHGHSFDLVEFGAGDGSKTAILLRYLLEHGTNFRFIPVDISAHALAQLTAQLRADLPQLEVIPVHGDYSSAGDARLPYSERPKLALFLGSNIGNYPMPDGIRLLEHFGAQLHKGDLLLTGFDLKKDPAIILAAYNDAAGITCAFNLNLLQRINRELGADFDVESFRHWPTYNPQTGACESYLVSLRKQAVHFASSGIQITFEPWETMYMELSHKYDLRTIDEMAAASGFKVLRHFTDSRAWFANSLWEKR